MTLRIVTIPTRLELETAVALTAQIAALPDDTSILQLDFSGWTHEFFVTPFGMLLFSAAVTTLKRRIPHLIVLAAHVPSSGAIGYVEHMGFFQSCGINLGKAPGAAKGGMTYLPITPTACTEIRDGRDAEELGHKLARNLTQQPGGALVDTLTYSFREIIRNVIEHSKSPDFWLCAQYWAGRGEAEIALIDAGIGLRASLSRNPYVDDLLTDDAITLKYAIMPGVSGKRWGTALGIDDEWANSGYGLYMMYRLCDEGGNFYIASGSKGLLREREADNVYLDHHLPGVALRLRLRADALNRFEADGLRRRFLADAVALSQEVEGGIMPDGARMSQMLRSGFASVKKDQS